MTRAGRSMTGARTWSSASQARAQQERSATATRVAGARRASCCCRRRPATATASCSIGLALIDDPHRRYWAGVGLVEAGLAARASTTTARSPALLVTLAGGALGAARARAERAAAAQPTPASPSSSCGASTPPRRCSRRHGAWTRELPGRWSANSRELAARRRGGRSRGRRAPLRAALPELGAPGARDRQRARSRRRACA